MKQIAAAALALMLLLSLSACFSPGPAPSPAGKGAVPAPAADGLSGGKTALKIASVTQTRQLQYAITQFEKTHSGIDVQLTDFSSQIVGMKSSEQAIDIAPMIQQLNTEMMSGAGPDVIDVDYLPYYKYADKGLLEDLGALMAGDKGFDRGQYLENVLAACQSGGKLFAVPSSFSFSVLSCRAENSPGAGNVTVDAFVRKAEALPQGVSAFAKDDPINIFSLFMQDNYSAFVDFGAHTATFDSPAFIGSLKAFKGLFDAKMSNEDSRDGKEYEQMMKGTVAYSVQAVRRNMDVAMAKTALGETAAFTNVPVMGDGDAYPFVARDMLAVNANGKNRDAAWEFVKTMLSQDVQSNGGPEGFPVLKAACDARIGTLADQVSVLNKNGKKMGLKFGDTNVELQPLGAADLAWLRDRVGKLNRLSAFDDTIEKILQEELPPFFDGQKSAEDVAGLVQNRVNIVLNE